MLFYVIDDVYDNKEDGWVTINKAKFRIENGEIVTGPKSARSALNKSDRNKSKVIKADQHGNKWRFPTRRLPKSEYGKVTGEIDVRYNNGWYRGREFGRIVTNPSNSALACTYIFEVHEYPGDYPEYNIIYKRRNDR